jgi:general secretion pathway protein C
LNLPANVFGTLRPRALIAAAEVALVAALAAQGARLVWTVATPAGPLGSAAVVRGDARPAQDLGILARFDPFFRLPQVAPDEAATSGGGFTLFGVRAGAAGRGSAILGDADGRQQIFDVGDEVQPGVVLTSVGRDHVTLSRGAARQRLDFPQPSAAGAAGQMAPILPPAAPPAPAGATAPQAAAPASPPVDPQRLLGQAGLLPRLKDGRPDGYRVLARGGSDVLRTAGLQSGDVLLAVDGVGLTPERLSELPQTLSASTETEIRFERAGQIMTTRIRMASR